ncbi:hypothetical protein D4764_0126230 [Takifugu flavidus]|uniref:Uncharacterized protein n=1 Tax=Takifugu flavidus TaxID=433684 RepID=A0A5C6MFZ4_9TELE|nr:hypothetical protein D4764_0126230 [Takifugu flavidus]
MMVSPPIYVPWPKPGHHCPQTSVLCPSDAAESWPEELALLLGHEVVVWSPHCRGLGLPRCTGLHNGTSNNDSTSSSKGSNLCLIYPGWTLVILETLCSGAFWDVVFEMFSDF